MVVVSTKALKSLALSIPLKGHSVGDQTRSLANTCIVMNTSQRSSTYCLTGLQELYRLSPEGLGARVVLVGDESSHSCLFSKPIVIKETLNIPEPLACFPDK